MALTPPAPRFTRSPHLVALVAEAERLAATVANAPAPAREQLAERTRAEARIATLVLDGASAQQLPELPQAATLPADAAPQPAQGATHRGTWLDTLRVVEEPDDERIRALEVLGVAATDASDDLAEQLLVEPRPALAELHRRLTRGLIHETRAGAPRETEQAVHDASTGRMIHTTVPPPRIPGELALLAAWISSTGAREHAVIASGVLHLELLRIHPFDAANGRLARAAARLVLRARGLDPDGLAAPEPVLATDRLGYAEEVARTLRRRDATIWLERWAEAVTDGLRASARDLGSLDLPRLADRAVDFVGGRADPSFTIADYRADAHVGPEDARADLSALLDAGLVQRVPGSRGLRFRVAPQARSG